MNHRPRKRFGQNFLQSQPVINNIVTALDLRREDNVIEIGPGLGALTQPLLRMLNKLIAVEIDRDLQVSLMNSLGSSGKLNLIAADALTLDYSSFGNELRIVGNLPYNISTPLLLYLLTFASHIKDMHFMLQKEVVNRLAGQPGSKAYGRLSVMVQYHCEVLPLFDVPPDAFYPEPKVDSSIVRLTPHAVPLYPAVSLEGLQSLVAMAFSMRRKTLANNLKPAITAEQLGFLGINPALRPEQISIAEYIRITDFLQLDTCPVKTVE